MNPQASLGICKLLILRPTRITKKAEKAYPWHATGTRLSEAAPKMAGYVAALKQRGRQVIGVARHLGDSELCGQSSGAPMRSGRGLVVQGGVDDPR